MVVIGRKESGGKSNSAKLRVEEGGRYEAIVEGALNRPAVWLVMATSVLTGGGRAAVGSAPGPYADHPASAERDEA